MLTRKATARITKATCETKGPLGSRKAARIRSAREPSMERRIP